MWTVSMPVIFNYITAGDLYCIISKILNCITTSIIYCIIVSDMYLNSTKV